MAETRTIEEMARDIFELTKTSWMVTQRTKVDGPWDITDQEFLTLDILEQRQTMIVGDLQRYLEVLPAQMSRIIRALEGRKPPLIRCSINPQDKRKVDVTLTRAGQEAVESFRRAKLQRTIDTLSDLSPADRGELMRIFDIMRANLSRRFPPSQPK